jgi:hypothetical protein
MMLVTLRVRNQKVYLKTYLEKLNSMRRGNQPTLYKDDNGDVFAVNLGADYCAEHECGDEGIRQTMGCNSKVVGLGRYSATNKKPAMYSFKWKNVFYVIVPTYTYGTNEYMIDSFKKREHSELHLCKESKFGDKIYPAETLAGAWSNSDFGIAVSTKDKEAYSFVQKLAKAIESGDYAVWFDGKNSSNPFARSGLVIAIASKVPESIKAYMIECDIEADELAKADEETGIKNLLREKKKGFFACSSKWVFGMKLLSTLATEYEIVYWLNPFDQENNNHGFFTVEQLRDWANDVEGNVVSKVKAVA